MSPKTRSNLEQERNLALAEFALAAQRAEEAKRALQTYDLTEEGLAENWLTAQGISIAFARDNQDDEIPGQYVLETAEILSLAERLVPKPTIAREIGPMVCSTGRFP